MNDCVNLKNLHSSLFSPFGFATSSLQSAEYADSGFWHFLFMFRCTEKKASCSSTFQNVNSKEVNSGGIERTYVTT